MAAPMMVMACRGVPSVEAQAKGSLAVARLAEVGLDWARLVMVVVATEGKERMRRHHA